MKVVHPTAEFCKDQTRRHTADGLLSVSYHALCTNTLNEIHPAGHQKPHGMVISSCTASLARDGEEYQADCLQMMTIQLGVARPAASMHPHLVVLLSLLQHVNSNRSHRYGERH